MGSGTLTDEQARLVVRWWVRCWWCVVLAAATALVVGMVW